MGTPKTKMHFSERQREREREREGEGERERECVCVCVFVCLCVCVSETEPLLWMCLIYGRDFRSLPKPSNVSGRDSLYQHSELIYWRAQETVRRTFCRFARF